MYSVVIQQAADKAPVPKKSLLKRWAEKALSKNITTAEVTIRIVDLQEMTMLNETYRHKKGPTNVLSFPLSVPEDIDLELPELGDIVICAEVVNREAQEQGKAQEAHWAHMVVHGIFHLLGYDHETDEQAEEMEAQEIEVMQELGYPNPYSTGEEIKNYD